MLILGDAVKSGVDLGLRHSFADISATILEYFEVAQEETAGKSFWQEVQK